MSDQLSNLRVIDPVLTNIAHGYVQADSIAPFIAPIVEVPVRAGKVIKFGKEQFLVVDTRRAPGAELKRVRVSYTNENYLLYQHAAAAEVTQEEWEEAMNGPAQVNLQTAAVQRAAQAVAQSLEKEVVSLITTSGNYESNCYESLAGTDQFDHSQSDPEVIVNEFKEAIRSQVGVYPNSMVIAPNVYKALKQHPIFRDRIKYTSVGTVNLDLLAQWFDLTRGVKVASKVYLDDATGKLVDFVNNSVVLFYNPEGGIGQGLTPVGGDDRAKPAFAYSYALKNYPVVGTQRYNADRRVFINDFVSELQPQLVGLGSTGKVGAGALLANVLANP